MIAVCQSHNRPCLYEIPSDEWTPVGRNPEGFECFKKWSIRCDAPKCPHIYTLSHSRKTNELTWALDGCEGMYVKANCVQIKRGGKHLTFGTQKLKLDYNEKGETPHEAVCLPSEPSSSNTRHVSVTGFKPHKVYNVTCSRHGEVYLTIVHDRENNQCVVSGTALVGKTRLDKIDKGGKVYLFHGKEVKIPYNDGLSEEPSLFRFMNSSYYGRGQHPWDRFGGW